MAKKRIRPDAELEWRRKIKRLVVIAMFSDDVLMEQVVLKGGNALDLVHHIGNRASVDVDLSIDGDFAPEVRETLDSRVIKALSETFRPEGLQVFDVKMIDVPPGLSAEVQDFWGGYHIEFKLIEVERFEKFKDDVEKLRKNAVELGRGTRFLIDVSKHEFTKGKVRADLDGFAIFVYTPEMIVCEKLRAICQQMPEYGPIVKRNRAGSSRARDFIDIHGVIEARARDFPTTRSRELLSNIFAAKRVDRRLLRLVKKYREFHRTSYDAVVAAMNPGVVLKGFDFYFDFVLGLIPRLEPLGDE